ncbi:MAG: hypothetical protein JSW53_02780 [Candidatus Bathyarchaeota archaeon]|nr:MAG: hypothetical protein JSW53_02780 [Candidatus Bathyarchaeota archaeon]
MVIPRRFLFVILATIVVIAVVAGWFLTRRTEPVKFSIDRSVIGDGENATVTVTMENIYMREHYVEYRFKVSHRVDIYEGAEKLLARINSQFVFNYTLEASIPSVTRVFLVIGRLEEDVLSAEYPISLSIYFDGEEQEKTWSDLILKVQR